MKQTIADRMCFNKRLYINEMVASVAIGKMRVKYPESSHFNWHSYKCPNCGGYHITKQAQNKVEYQKRKFMAGF